MQKVSPRSPLKVAEAQGRFLRKQTSLFSQQGCNVSLPLGGAKTCFLNLQNLLGGSTSASGKFHYAFYKTNPCLLFVMPLLAESCDLSSICAEVSRSQCWERPGSNSKPHQGTQGADCWSSSEQLCPIVYTTICIGASKAKPGTRCNPITG